MGMGIELFSIREWEWELIPIFWQRMGMGINSSFLVNGPKSARLEVSDMILHPWSIY